MNENAHTDIEIRPVSGKRALNAFIKLPWKIYQGDPNWVPPLLMERKQALSPSHPFFQHADWRGWMAYIGGEPVGRICAQIDHLHQKRYDSKTGFFGLIESIEDDRVFQALFTTAENWLREQGMQQVLGPFNLGINQETGLLFEGFDSPPYIMMGHAKPYYDASVQRCNYQPAQDLLAYQLDAEKMAIPRTMLALLKRSSHRLNVRPFNTKKKTEEFEIMRKIFNDAWKNNWNFVPFTKQEFRAVGKELLMLLPANFIQIAEVDGKPSAFLTLLPNLNEVIADLNGRLLPFGWAKLLWRLKVNFPKTGRVALMGVREKYQNTRFGPGLAYMTIKAVTDAGKAKGLNRVELSWVLDHNRPTRNIIEGVGGEITKRYRMYEKTL